MRAEVVATILDARAQVSYLKNEKNVSFNFMSENEAIAFLEERNFFFKLKAFAKNFEKYRCKPGEKGRYINLDFGHLVELSRLDKALRSLVLDLALDIEHYLKVRINAAAMRTDVDPFTLVDAFLKNSSTSVISEQVRMLNKTVGKMRSKQPYRYSKNAALTDQTPSSPPPTAPQPNYLRQQAAGILGISSTPSKEWVDLRIQARSSGSTLIRQFPSGHYLNLSLLALS